MKKKKILIVGFGNEFCGDDGLGPYVVRRLKEQIGQGKEDISKSVSPEGRKQKAESRKQKIEKNMKPLLPTAHCLLPTEVDLQTARHLDFSWAEVLADYQHLIFVDASPHPGYPLVKVKPLGAARARRPFTSHHLSISHLLQITQNLFGRKPSAHLVAVGGENFDFGEQLSPRGRRSAPKAVKKILSLIKELAPAR